MPLDAPRWRTKVFPCLEITGHELAFIARELIQEGPEHIALESFTLIDILEVVPELGELVALQG